MANAKDDLGFVADDVGFVPDEHDDVGFVSDEDSSMMSGVGHHLVENLPIYGATIGGLAGGTAAGIPTLGLGSVAGGMAGAGAGGAIGSAAKNFIKQNFMDEPMTTEQILTEPLREGVMGVAGEAGGQLVGLAGKGVLKASQELSGVPAQAAKVFSERYPEISKMTKQYGDDVFAAANDARGRISEAIRSFKGDRNSKIGSAIEKSLETVDLNPVAEHLDQVRASLDPVADRVALAKLDSLLEDINSVMARPGNADGNVNLGDANAIKKIIQSSTDFDPMNAALSKNTTFNAGMTRAGGKTNAIMSAASPELKSANKDLSRLHRITKKANKNLFDVDAPEGALAEAGAGKMPRNMDILNRITELIGTNVSKEAENIGAMKYLGNAGLLPKERTGFVAPLIAGVGGAGYSALDGDWETGLKIAGAGALASPVVLKQLLKGKYLMNEFPKAVGMPVKAAIRSGTQNASQALLSGVIPQAPPPVPLTEDDLKRMNLPATERAEKINQIRKGVPVFQ